MTDLVRMRVADLNIEVRALNPNLRRLCRDYVVDGPDAASDFVPDISVEVAQSDIEREREHSDPEKSWSDGYLETLAVLRELALAMPGRDRVLMHGAVLEYAGQAYMFTARSGTGKSTHMRLWRTCLGPDVKAVNGDKPFLYMPPDPTEPIKVYGTPWCGKEGWQSNVVRPLAGICFLSRAPEGHSGIRPLAPVDAIPQAIVQLYVPLSEDGTGRTLELLDQLLTRVPLWDLQVDMSEDAVRTSFEALTGEDFKECRARAERSGDNSAQNTQNKA